MRRNKLLPLMVLALLCLPTSIIMIPQAQAGPTPAIELTATTDKTNAQIGDEVIYTFKVANTGKVTLNSASVNSILAGAATKQSESIRTNDKMEPGEIWTFTDKYVVQEGDADPLINTATATANPRRGSPVTATDDCNIYLYGTEGDTLPDVLTSPNQEPNGGWYGCSVAVGEGLIVVGAAYESIPNPLYDPTLRRQTEPMQIYGAGRAYIYSSTTGALLRTLTSPNSASPGWFGYSVAVGEGVIVIGAPKETSGGIMLAGNAYTFDAITYDLLYTFTTPNPVSDDNGYGYGTSVAVNNGIIAIGSSWETVNSITAAGRVYLYNVNDGTATSFSPLVTLDPTEYGRFGVAVGVNDGVIVVGAPYENIVGTGGYAGPAGRVYTYSTTDGALINTITSVNAEFYGIFGSSVAVGGGKAIIGARGETVGGNDEAGRAYIYDLTSQTITNTLVSQNSQSRGMFGNSVAVGDGVFVVGAIIEDSGISYPDAGNAYVFNAGTGAYMETLTNPNPVDCTEFGWSVAANSGITVVGAYDAVFIFE